MCKDNTEPMLYWFKYQLFVSGGDKPSIMCKTIWGNSECFIMVQSHYTDNVRQCVETIQERPKLKFELKMN